ncbi:natural resistance-associated macrophage protein [Rhizopus microsporus var. microsporus]|uniref:Natural resistance-associated macrophage protein n=1 Tax=Rhizopus microsporus var. microsporus TaxID=86635 RepID=A0A1X0QZA5_RHIZD|nr:natural resistance-associated macrophage protein [Rhizopus microsporus var. microsporus]
MLKSFGRITKYLKTLGKFIGPGFMIAVGYLDPGNWATDMEGGSSFGYRLLFIILVSNIIAVFLQNLTIRLGTVTGLDLASASRKFFPKWLNLFLYVLAEIAIIATDIAEVIGSAIALNLLFPSLPLPAGVAITAVDVFIILLFYNEDVEDDENSTSGRMVRIFEIFVMMLVAAVGICFIIELAYSDIVAVDVFKGFLPTREIFTEPEVLYVAIGIIGATVMPHNLYLHSFIVQSRCREWKISRPKVATKYDALGNDHNLHYGFMDLLVALTFAFFVNCSILIVASANFYYTSGGQGQQQIQDLFSAHALLLQYLGPPAAVTFALALLCAGQSSTLTATLAGQVIMSGFLGMTTRPWIRRIVTRLIAITPAMVAACVAGRSGLSNMLVASQVALSIQLPFAVVPLVYLTSRRSTMKLDLRAVKDFFVQSSGQGEEEEERPSSDSSIEEKPNNRLTIDALPEPLVYANGKVTKVISVLVALLLIGLNGYLVVSLFMQI